MELIILYLPLFILIYSFYSLPINPGFPVDENIDQRLKEKLTDTRK